MCAGIAEGWQIMYTRIKMLKLSGLSLHSPPSAIARNSEHFSHLVLIGKHLWYNKPTSALKKSQIYRNLTLNLIQANISHPAWALFLILLQQSEST